MKGEIINIICPYCKNYKLYQSKNKFLDITWKCPGCVHTFPYTWFDIFHQYEEFVERKVLK